MIEIKHKDTGEVLHVANGDTLQKANLRGLNLHGADFSNMNLREADLREANLSEANLHKANLEIVGLRESNLSSADLREANLFGADLSEANLSEADLSGARLGLTTFANCPTLHEAKGLDTIVHVDASTLNVHTLRACAADLPDVFLQSVGYNPLIVQIQRLTEIWDANKANQNEEFWHNILTSNSLLLSQVFSIPVVLLENKAYVGGKKIDNTNGGIVNFLLVNPVTENVGLVEIKTPSARLLGSEYRANVYSPSQELSGAVVQVLDYKDKLTKEYHALRSRSLDDGLAVFRSFNPQCVVIAGNFGVELQNEHQKKSFDLFRSGWKDVLIITFDELFAKIKNLDALLGGYYSQTTKSE